MSTWRDDLSRNLKSYRSSYGWSQDVLAEKAGCSKSVVRDLEAKSRGVSLDMLSNLALALNVPVELLFKSDRVGAEAGASLNQVEINSLAKEATVHSLIEALGARLGAIPEEVLEMARFFDEADPVWRRIMIVMNDRSREIARENIAKKNKA